MRKLKVLIAGRSADAARSAEDLLARHPQCISEVRILSNGHVDPLHDRKEMPDLLLLCDLHATDELKTLANLPAEERPPLVVFGEGQDASAVRLAMRAGARDYLSLPLDEQELHGIVKQFIDDLESKARDTNGELHVFINGKGGSGATFLATNVAHGLASNEQSVTLVDLDLQFAGLCHYLDLTPKRDIIEAISTVTDMDEISARAFTSEHESGLRLLSRLPEGQLKMSVDVNPGNLVALLNTYRSFNDFVIIDMPRHIDPVSVAVLEQADRISIVMQQSFPHVHGTARLLNILRNELGIAISQVAIIVNRFDRNSPILLTDIEKALRIDDVVKIPNHYASTTESINSGIPLTDVTSRSAVSKALADYCQVLAPMPVDTTATSTLQRLFRRS